MSDALQRIEQQSGHAGKELHKPAQQVSSAWLSEAQKAECLQQAQVCKRELCACTWHAYGPVARCFSAAKSGQAAAEMVAGVRPQLCSSSTGHNCSNMPAELAERHMSAAPAKGNSRDAGGGRQALRKALKGE